MLYSPQDLGVGLGAPLKNKTICHFSNQNQTNHSGLSHPSVAAHQKKRWQWCLNVSRHVLIHNSAFQYTKRFGLCDPFHTSDSQDYCRPHPHFQRKKLILSADHEKKRIWIIILTHPRSQKKPPPFERPHARCEAPVGCHGKAARSSERNPSSTSRRR